jgi:hypothetical protein
MVRYGNCFQQSELGKLVTRLPARRFKSLRQIDTCNKRRWQVYQMITNWDIVAYDSLIETGLIWYMDSFSLRRRKP